MPFSEIVKAIQYGMHFRLFEINRTAITLSSLIMFFAVIFVFALISFACSLYVNGFGRVMSAQPSLIWEKED